MTNRGPFEAVIFDLDGVLADSEPAHFMAINSVLNRHGTQLTHEQQKAQMGLGFEDSMRMTMADSGVQIPREQLAAEYDAELIEILGNGYVPLPGAVELVLRLQGAAIPIAVASSSLPGWIDATLAGIGLGSVFRVVVSGESVEHPKPAPDIYLRAAELVGVTPEKCIAIEDSIYGLHSAKAAGMYSIQVRSSSSPFPPQPEADLVLDTLLDFPFLLLGSEPAPEPTFG